MTRQSFEDELTICYQMSRGTNHKILQINEVIDYLMFKAQTEKLRAVGYVIEKAMEECYSILNADEQSIIKKEGVK